jgi:transcriptional regulator with XRE-family HTH domain
MVAIELSANDLSERAPTSLDAALGARIRQRRRQLGYSQEQLAQRVGVTFQQIQKYEHGANRVSFSRLVEVARALKCNLVDLVGDLVQLEPSGAVIARDIQLSEPGVLELIDNYSRIGSPCCRRAIVDLARELAERMGAAPAVTAAASQAP